MHHYMYGLILIVLSILFESLILYAVGLGLFIDELTYLLMRGKTHEDNYSTVSLLGTAILVTAVFIFKDYLILLF